VLFRGDDIAAHGYNYKPRGFDCDGSVACKATCRVEAIHAEQQALLSLGRHTNGTDMLHVKTVDGRLVASGGPSCVECSKLVLIAGVTFVWLYHVDGWRRYEASEFHRLSVDSTQVAKDSEAQVLGSGCGGERRGDQESDSRGSH
jgi:deoxycytidylate deaminase